MCLGPNEYNAAWGSRGNGKEYMARGLEAGGYGEVGGRDGSDGVRVGAA